MISSLAGKLAGSGFSKLAEFILKMGIATVGNNAKISFHFRNRWTHYKDSWIINEFLPILGSIRREADEFYKGISTLKITCQAVKTFLLMLGVRELEWKACF